MIYLILALSLAAVIVEGYDDRLGEDKKGKIRDSVYLIAAASSISLIAYWFANVQPLKTIALVLAVRVLTFDYVCNWFLKKYHEDFKNINIFSFVGITAFTDKLVSKVHPWLRLTIRVALFALAVWWFIH